MSEQQTSKELVLGPGEYAYTQDTSKGSVHVHTGPNVITLTGQQYTVKYDARTREFSRCTLAEAKAQFTLLAQGHYAILWNPSEKEDDFPADASSKTAPTLLAGKRIVLHGPKTFALWPRQSAKVIKGHYLRSNQYVLCRVYDEVSAKENYDRMVMRTVSGAEGAEGAQDISRITGVKAEELTHGKQFIVRGTEVSFFMPPTGFRVVPEDEEARQEKDNHQGEPKLLAADTSGYVRDALTLERLQYCILVDENGDKRYEKGPQVVFPRPTERFYADAKSGAKIFKATELNEGQGIYVKVIAAYEDEETDRRYKEGEELFITGKETTIYYPRSEHALLKYEGHTKHFATAIPEGEGRYVMNRQTAEIRTIRGPDMLLPDPRSSVIVRRALTDKESALWYPNNTESLEYNRLLRSLQEDKPTTRAAVSETELQRAVSRESMKGGRSRALMAQAASPAVMNFMTADSSSVHSAASGEMADEFVRGSSYTEPRTITLNTKFSGVPRIIPRTGYAVMVVNAKGQRRVVKGPATILLEYDETLEQLSLSKGKPKTTDQVENTVYLRVENNQIGDVVTVETADHVTAQVKISLRGDFFGDGDEANKWFGVENYVKLVTDHVRSVLKGIIQKKPIREFHTDPTALVRDAILGGRISGGPGDGERKGMVFDEINFRVKDVEVLGVQIGDQNIANLLYDQQHHVVVSDISLMKAKKALEVEKENQKIAQETALAGADTEAFRAKLALEKIGRDLQLTEARLKSQQEELEYKGVVQQLSDQLAGETLAQQVQRDNLQAEFKQKIEQAILQLELARTEANTKATVERYKAAEGSLSEAIQLLGNQDVVTKVAAALSAQKLFGGQDAADVMSNLFKGTGLESFFQRALDGGSKNGKSSPATSTTPSART